MDDQAVNILPNAAVYSHLVTTAGLGRVLHVDKPYMSAFPFLFSSKPLFVFTSSSAIICVF